MALSNDVKTAFDLTLSCLSGLIVILNAAVIALVFLNKNIRTFTNGFVVSLALSDILTGGVFFPIVISATPVPVLPYLVCIILLLGVANVCCVTYDRYISISSPLTYALDIRKRFKLMIVLCWTVPVIYALIPMFWETNHTLLIHKIYIYTLEIFGVVIPFIFIFSIYCYIFSQVRRCNKRLKNDLTDNETSKKRRKSLFSEAKVARVFVTVAVLFLISWVPILYITTMVTLGLPHLVPGVLHLVAFYALALGSMVNPILYCFMKPDIKATLKKYYARRWPNAPRASFSSRTATAAIILVSNSNNSNENTKL